MISAKFVPLKYYTLSSQLRRLTSFSVGCSSRRILSLGQIAVMRKWSITGLIFPSKKGPIRKENSFECITSLRFSFYQITNKYLIQTLLNTWEELNTLRHISSYYHRYGYISTLNYTGTEQVIQWAT